MQQKLWRKPLDTQKVKVPKAKVQIIRDFCKGCGFCIEFCPKKILEKSNQLNRRGAYLPKVTDEDKCASCGFCAAICPEFAIFTIENKPKEGHMNGEER